MNTLISIERIIIRFSSLLKCLSNKLSIVSLSFWGLSLLPQIGRATTGDSTKYLTLKDTIFISLDDKSGEKIFEHKIQKGQTLYSLARFYGLNEEELYPYNPNLKSNVVGLGQIIKLPIPNAAIKRFKGDNFKRWKYAPIAFKVKKGDNLYKIAKTLFHMPIDSVVKWNNLPNETIAPGQILHVGWMSLNGVPDSVRNLRKSTIDLKKKELEAKFSGQKKSIEQKGAAFWQKKGNPNTHYYCLHRTAKVGSIISVTNGMNFKTLYAKVIGKIPQNAFGDEVIIIVSPSVAKQLGAKDERFFVKIKYVE
jgi:LysM repeat protein